VLFIFEYSCDPKQATCVACGGESKDGAMFTSESGQQVLMNEMN